jgi:hypothetical protein
MGVRRHGSRRCWSGVGVRRHEPPLLEPDQSYQVVEIGDPRLLRKIEPDRDQADDEDQATNPHRHTTAYGALEDPPKYQGHHRYRDDADTYLQQIDTRELDDPHSFSQIPWLPTC